MYEVEERFLEGEGCRNGGVARRVEVENSACVFRSL